MAGRVELSGREKKEITDGKVPDTRGVVGKLNGQKFAVINEREEAEVKSFVLKGDEYIETVIKQIGKKCIKANLTENEYKALTNTLVKQIDRMNNQDIVNDWDDPDLLTSALEKIKQSV